MSLRYRIALTILALGALFLALLLTNTLGYSRDATTREIVRSEETTLSLLAEISRRAFLTGEYAELQPFVERLADRAHVLHVRIADERGRTVVSTEPAEVGVLLPELQTSEEPAGWRIVGVSNVAGPLGTVAIRFSQAALQAAHEEARARGVAVALAGVTLLALAGLVTGVLLTRRLESVAEASHRFAAGDHAARARTPGRDEIAQVGEAFDVMAARIEIQMEDLRQSESRHRELLEQMGDLVQTMSPDGRLLMVNDAWRRALGREDADLENLDLAELLGDEMQAASLLREAMDAETSVYRSLTLRHHETGKPVVVDATVTAVRDDGRTLSILAVMRDVTERLDLLYELRAKEEQLRHAQRMEGLGRLAGGVAHDFNNILTVVLGEADNLISGLDESDPLHLSALEIERSAKRAAELTRQLLAFGRRDVVKPEILDLDETVRGLEPMLRRLIGEDVVLRVATRAGGARIELDEGHFHQVIVNLVVNARDALPDGGSIQLETSRILRRGRSPSSGRSDERWLAGLAVRDSGVGMDEETRQRVFDPFFTTKERGKGSGLGLSTVYGIVAQAGGDIEILSTRGEGSTFLVLLPEVAAPLSGREEPRPAPTSHEGGRILLVEDDDAVRAITRRLLTSAGYEVTEAASPTEALSRVAQRGQIFDLIVSDLVMPGMSGVELVRRLREAHPGIRVLFMSGYSDVQPAQVDDELLAKPFAPGAMLASVRRALGKDGAEGA